MGLARRLTTSNCYKFSNISEIMKDSVNGAVKEASDASTLKVFMLWDEAHLVLVNFPEAVKKELKFISRVMSMEEDKRGFMKAVFSIKEIEPYSTFLKGDHKAEILLTLPGYWRRLMIWAISQGLDLTFRDLRAGNLLPAPDFSLMHGFRFNQQQITEQALACGHAGMIKAPTRFGKSTILTNIIRAFGDEVCTVVIAPGRSLIRQLTKDLRAAFPHREVKQFGGGATTNYMTSTGINVCSVDSLHLIDAFEPRLVVVDEPHTTVSVTRLALIGRFQLARYYAVGATLEGRYDKMDAMLEGLFGPVVARVTYREAVAMGAVAQLKVVMVKIPVPREAGTRDKIFRKYVLGNRKIHSLCAKLCNEWIPEGDQALFFIKQEKQALAMREFMGDHIPIVMDKILSSKERDELTRQVEENEISRVQCSDIFVQGVTFHDIRYLINCNGGGPSTAAIQRPGRLAEIRPDKTCGVMVDFKPIKEAKPKAGKYTGDNTRPDRGEADMRGINAICREACQRQEVYEQIGYIVEEVEAHELEDWIKRNSTHEQ